MVSFLVRGLASVILAGTLSATGALGDAHVSLMPVAVAEAPTEADPFYGYPTLKRICACESGLVHYTDEGSVIRGKVNRHDIGMCQINELYHEQEIKESGIDIYTPEGNVEFAKRLFDRQGSAPWVWSKKCWNNT